VNNFIITECALTDLFLQVVDTNSSTQSQ